MVPQTMIPYYVYGPACIGQVVECTCCPRKFSLEEGVVWQTRFKCEGEMKFGYIPFCDLDCLLRGANIYGNC